MTERPRPNEKTLDKVAEELRNSEWARSISPTGPHEQSQEWARMRVEVVLDALIDSGEFVPADEDIATIFDRSRRSANALRAERDELRTERDRMRLIIADLIEGETAEEGTPQWYALRNARAALAEWDPNTYGDLMNEDFGV